MFHAVLSLKECVMNSGALATMNIDTRARARLYTQSQTSLDDDDDDDIDGLPSTFCRSTNVV